MASKTPRGITPDTTSGSPSAGRISSTPKRTRSVGARAPVITPKRPLVRVIGHVKRKNVGKNIPVKIPLHLENVTIPEIGVTIRFGREKLSGKIFERDGIIILEIIPIGPGTYVSDLSVSGMPVGGSPIVVTLDFGDSRLEGVPVGPLTTIIGTPLAIPFTARLGLDPTTLEALTRDEEGKETGTWRISAKKGNPKFELIIVPEKIGKIFAEILEKNIALGNNPFVVEVVPVLVQPHVPGKNSIIPDISVPLSIEGISAGEISVSVHDPAGRDCPCELVPGVDGGVILNVQTNQLGVHAVTLHAKGAVIAELTLDNRKDTPAEEPISAAPDSAEDSGIYTGKLTRIPLSVEGADPRSLEAVVTDPLGKIVENSINSDDGGIFLNFIPQCPGLHVVSLSVGEEVVAEIKIRVSQIPEPGQIWECVRLQTASLPLELEGVKPEDLHVILRNSIGKIVSGSITKKENEIFLEFRPVKKGLHTVTLSVAGNVVSEFPIRVVEGNLSKKDVPNIPDWEYFWGIDPPHVGKKTHLPLSVSGVDLEALKVFMKDPQGRKEACKVTGTTSGDVLITFYPLISGLHVAELLVAGKVVANMPITVLV